MGSQKHKLIGVALLGALITMPAQMSAQQPAAQQQACSAQLNPAQVAAGEDATPVTIRVSQPMGEVTGVRAAEGSGVRLADATDLPRTPLAGPDDAPAPIRMGDSETTWIIYLNTAEAESGTHQLTFTSTRGPCSAELTIR